MFHLEISPFLQIKNFKTFLPNISIFQINHVKKINTAVTTVPSFLCLGTFKFRFVLPSLLVHSIAVVKRFTYGGCVYAMAALGHDAVENLSLPQDLCQIPRDINLKAEQKKNTL